MHFLQLSVAGSVLFLFLLVKGYTLGYSHMFKLSKKGNFFLETGAFFQYFQRKDYELSHYYDDDNNMITINFKAYRYARAYIPVKESLSSYNTTIKK